MELTSIINALNSSINKDSGKFFILKTSVEPTVSNAYKTYRLVLYLHSPEGNKQVLEYTHTGLYLKGKESALLNVGNEGFMSALFTFLRNTDEII